MASILSGRLRQRGTTCYATITKHRVSSRRYSSSRPRRPPISQGQPLSSLRANSIESREIGASTCIDPLGWNEPRPSSRSISTHSLDVNTQPGILHTSNPENTISTLTIHNPLKLNTLSTPLLQQLTQTCTALSSSPTLRAVILTSTSPPPGKPPSFIGGADINEMSRLSNPKAAEAFITRVHDACESIRSIPVPVIARINGLTLGAGLEIAISCDLRIATGDSVFGMPEVRVGIPSVIHAALLPTLLPSGLVRRLLYLCDNLTASEALEHGLIERVVTSPAHLDAALDEWIAKLMEAGPNAIRIQKRLMRTWEEKRGVDQSIREGIGAFGKSFEDGGEEPKEYMSRFLNRRRG